MAQTAATAPAVADEGRSRAGFLPRVNVSALVMTLYPRLIQRRGS